MRRVLGSLLIAALLCCSGWVWARPKPPTAPDGETLQNIITVSPSGGRFETLTEAVDYLATVSPPPSEDNRFLIRVGPGTYEGPVEMVEWVNIEGSGQDVTVVWAAGSSDFYEAWTILGADHAELANLTVRSVGGFAHAIGVYCEDTSPTLRLVRIVASDGNMNRGVMATRSRVELEGVVVEATGGVWSRALHAVEGAPTIVDSQFLAAGTTDVCGVSVNSLDDVARIIDSTILAGSGQEAKAVGVSVFRSGGVWLDDVEIVARSSGTSTALEVTDTVPVVELKDCSLTAAGLYNSDAVFDYSYYGEPLDRYVTDSILRGDRSSIYIQTTNRYFIGTSQLSGPLVSTSWGGTGQCVASFDAEFQPLKADCSPAGAGTPTPTPQVTPTPTPYVPTTTPTPYWTPTPTPTSTYTPTPTS